MPLAILCCFSFSQSAFFLLTGLMELKFLRAYRVVKFGHGLLLRLHSYKPDTWLTLLEPVLGVTKIILLSPTQPKQQAILLTRQPLKKPSPLFLFSKVCPIENNTNFKSNFCLIKSSKIDFIFLSAFYLIIWLMA